MPHYPDHSEHYPTGASETVLAKIGETGIRNIAPDTMRSTLDILTPLERMPFELGLAQTAQLYGRIGITPPLLETFEQSGIDFKRLAGIQNDMEQDGLKPVAVFSKADLSLDEALALYAHLRADEDIPHNPLRKQILRFFKHEHGERKRGEYSYDGLAINSGVAQNWQKITTQQEPLEATHGWTLRLVASSHEAPWNNAGYSDLLPRDDGLPRTYTHVTIPEYLTLQARLIQAGEPPIDNDEFIWLDSTDTFTPYYIEHPRAPIGKWSPEEGYVFIGHDRVTGNAGKTMNGARPARSQFKVSPARPCVDAGLQE